MRVILVHQEPTVEGLSSLDYDVLARIHGEVLESNNFRVPRQPFFQKHFESAVLNREFETSLRTLISRNCLEVPLHQRIEQVFQITQLGFEICVDAVEWSRLLDQTFMVILNCRDDGTEPDIEILSDQVGVQPIEMRFLLRHLDGRRVINLEETGDGNEKWGIRVRVAEVDVVREREFRADPPRPQDAGIDAENAEPSPITVADSIRSSYDLSSDHSEIVDRPQRDRKWIKGFLLAVGVLVGSTALVWLIDTALDLALREELNTFIQGVFSGSEQPIDDSTTR